MVICSSAKKRFPFVSPDQVALTPVGVRTVENLELESGKCNDGVAEPAGPEVLNNRAPQGLCRDFMSETLPVIWPTPRGMRTSFVDAAL